MVKPITHGHCKFCGKYFEAVLYHEDQCSLKPAPKRPRWLAWFFNSWE